jgi:class 3 adenylate cyclase
MSFHSIREIEEVLRPGANASIRDLYTIWEQRQPAPRTPERHATTGAATAPQLRWLQGDPGVVTAFTQQALLKEEYLLVCDACGEAITYWSGQAKESQDANLKGIILLRSHYAAARTRLGFTRSARNILEPLAGNPRLSREEQAQVLLQIADIVREESHYAPDFATRRQTAANALALYQQALASDPDLVEAIVLSASMLLILAENQSSLLDEARDSALQALIRIDAVEKSQEPTFRTTWFRAISHSVLGRLDESAEFYSRLQNRPDASTANLAEARFRSQFLAEALGKDRRHFYGAFPPLQLLVFSGHLPDLPGRPPRFPHESIPLVRQLLRQKLDQIQARAGLVSAAAGADLLFIEAMLERPGAKYHVVLPWSKEEFFRTSVAPFESSGQPPVWEPLFRQGLEHAATVRELGQAYEPGDDLGWEFSQEVMAGLALLTARMSRLEVQPLVLWDGNRSYGPGGTQSFVELWKHQLHQESQVIELSSKATSQSGPLPARSRSERLSLHQEVKSMLFADIVGYSKLTEKVMGEFVTLFMNRVSELMATSPHAPRSVNTWGDAIFAVFDFSHDAGQFALALTKMIRDGENDWKQRGLVYREYDPASDSVVERPLNIRVGLHTGPVLAHYNPILRQLGFTGSHVNRAARIEPIAGPGEIYASEEFAAMAELGAKIGCVDPDQDRAGGHQFVCEYAGTMSLAKSYPGRLRIYRVIPQRTLAMEELARAAHALYCDEQALAGKTRSENPVMRPWAELSEDLRDANRAQVADIPNKLYFLGYELAPSSGLAPSQIVLQPDQLESLSRREHERWMAERLRQGWILGPVRDDARKQHPVLVPWEALSEEEKRKDRYAVLKLPVLIEKAGFHVRKLPQASTI